MTTPRKKTIATSLPEEELAELDRVREQHSLTRSQALREAVRWYVGAMRRLAPPEEPLPDEVEALREAEAEFSRDGGRPLRAVLHDLERRPKQSGAIGLNGTPARDRQRITHALPSVEQEPLSGDVIPLKGHCGQHRAGPASAAKRPRTCVLLLVI